jgi:4-hydroxy-3-methylbut-2-en-1-yl diphosphate reductase
MEVKLAENYGFCFGVKRAIKIAEESPNSHTIGPLIHNPREINRLKENFKVSMTEDFSTLERGEKVVVRTHGIEKEKMAELHKRKFDVIDATCPYVTKPQEIVEEMSKEGYEIVIFGDIAHPEVKGVMSYSIIKPHVVLDEKELHGIRLKDRVSIVSQTTKKPEDFAKVVNYLMRHYKEVRVFNTICNATFENQDAASALAKEVDVMLVIGGKNSSNTKQLHEIAARECTNSYLIEGESDLDITWFKDKKLCGITAGASTPEWIVDNVVAFVSDI